MASSAADSAAAAAAADGNSSGRSSKPTPPTSASSTTTTQKTRLQGTATPQNFPVGQLAQRELRRSLKKSTDPAATISNFRDGRSLHRMFGRAFGTTVEADGGGAAGGDGGDGDGTDRGGSGEEETFRPDPALTFLHHLGSTRSDVHRSVASALRQSLESEIDRAPLPACRDALLGLLLSAWQFLGVSELRPVVAALIKKLGEGTPRQVLQALAEREAAVSGGGGEGGEGGGQQQSQQLKHAELLAQFSLPMRRLVYEADWEGAYGPDGSGSGNGSGDGTLDSPNVLADLVRPAVEDYRTDIAVQAGADSTFVGSVRERRVATQVRRTVVGGTGGGSSTGGGGGGPAAGGGGGALASITKSATATAADPKKSSGGGGGKASTAAAEGTEAGRHAKTSGAAVGAIREIIGDRPKLLGAVLNMLIAEHGRYAPKEESASSVAAAGAASPSTSTSTAAAAAPPVEETVLGGSAYLNCTLSADVVLTYGQLPRQYEHVGIMAKVLDDCVRIGTMKDDAVAQVQGCLRVIFQQKDGGGGQAGDGARGGGTAESGAASKSSSLLLGKSTKKNEKKAAAIAAAAKKAATAASAATSSARNKGSSAGKKPMSRDDTDHQRKLLRRIITAAVRAMKESDPRGLFLNPVTDSVAPGYSSIIKEPMCIRTIDERSNNLEYDMLQEYERDVNLMFTNCINYNIGKEGTWFRTEARRQQKLWRDEIASQAKALFKKESAKRKKQLERADMRDDEKRKLKSANPIATVSASASAAKIETAQDRKRRADQISRALVAAQDFNDDDAISRLTGKDVDPLPPSRAKRRKKDGDGPSMPALAAMLLADPFVVRICLDRILRSLRADVLKGAALPVGHTIVPSLLQLLYVAQFSTQLCAIRGKRFGIPDVGLTKAVAGEGDGGSGSSSADVPFASLRKYTPLLTRLLLESDLDRRIVPGGDLYDASSSLPPRPPADPKPWEGTSSLCVLRALTEGALVHIVQPGQSTEAALAVQFPRFLAALEGLSGGNLRSERPFFASFAQALLRHKHKLPHGTRDLVATAWLGWIRGGEPPKGKKISCMCAPVHECFILLLNEWTNFGNVVLPRDTMLSFAEEAAKAAEDSGKGAANAPVFASSWQDGGDAFAPIKSQYERMLNHIPEANASQWKEKMGIDDASLSLSEQGNPKEEAKSGETKEGEDEMDVDK